MCYSFKCKLPIRRSHGVAGKYKMLHFRNSTQNSVYFSLIFRSETLNVFEEHIFNLSVFGCSPFATDMRSFGHTNHHLKIMHVSVNTPTIFFIFRPTLGHTVYDLQKNLYCPASQE